MKKADILNMTIEERKAYFDNLVEEGKAKAAAKRTPEKLQQISRKIENNDRLTVEEFEILTGILFSHSMTGKMDGILSLSTNCLVNPYCLKRLAEKVGVCAECFAAAGMWKHDLSVNTAHNYKILSETEIPNNLVPVIEAEELRIESFGDCGSVTQAKNYIKLALYNEYVAVTAWTKNPFLYKQALKEMGIRKPENFTLIYSSQFLNQESEIPKGYEGIIDKVFTVYTLEYLQKNGIPASFINCGGRSCKNCRKCYTGSKNSPKQIHELLRADAKKARKAGYNIDGTPEAPADDPKVSEEVNELLKLFTA